MTKFDITKKLTSVVCMLCLLGTGAIGAITKVVAQADSSEQQQEAVILAEPLDAPATETVIANKLADPQLLEGVRQPWYSPVSSDGFLPVRFDAVSEDYLFGIPSVAAMAAISYQGHIVDQQKIGEGGVVQLRVGREGQHTVTAMGYDGFAALGTYVSNAPGPYPVPDPPVLHAGLVPGCDSAIALEILKSVPPTGGPAGQVVPLDVLQVALNRELVFVRDVQGVVSSRMVSMQGDSVVSNPQMTVSFIRDGQVVAEGVTDGLGVFSIATDHLATGYVSVVAVGGNGFAIFSARIIDEGRASIDEDSDLSYVAMENAGADSYIGTADSAAIGQFIQNLQNVIAGAGPMGPGGGGGGGGFGNYGGFGGGGAPGGDLSPFALAALAAGLGYALADDNDDNNNIVVISPPGP